MSILGNRVLRKEDPKFLTAGATYVADLHDARLAGAAYVTYVRATVAHATVTGVDVTAARSMPGVLGVFTAADVAELAPLTAMVPLFPPPMMTRPVVGTSSPATSRSTVLFPQPDGPTRTSNSPSATVRLRSRTAGWVAS